jgi:hypothetical protein
MTMPRVAPENRPSVIRATLSEPRTLKGAGHQLHLAHPGPSLRALVAQHYDVVRLDATLLDRSRCIFLALERLTGDLHDASPRGEVA